MSNRGLLKSILVKMDSGCQPTLHKSTWSMFRCGISLVIAAFVIEIFDLGPCLCHLHATSKNV